MGLNDILSKLEVGRNVYGEYYCKCPCHDDKTPSLHVTEKDGRVLIDCKAGCKTEDIIHAIGLKMSDLFVVESYQKKTNAERMREFIEKKTKCRFVEIYNYHSPDDDKECFSKVRLIDPETKTKSFRYGTIQDEKFIFGLPKDQAGQRQRREDIIAVYGSRKHEIEKARQEGTPVFYVEGEKDVNTLMEKGYVAFTFGASKDWSGKYAKYFSGLDVVILADNDTPGKELAQKVYESINNIATKVRIVIPTPDIEKGDISDYFQEGHTKEDFEKMILNNCESNLFGELKIHAKQIDETNNPSESTISLVDVLIELNASTKYETNDKGFGNLFADVFKGVHRYNSDRKEFMFYDGKKWIDDIEGMFARKSAKELSDALLHYAIDSEFDGDNSEYLKKVWSLVNIRNRNNMLQDCKDVYFIRNEDLDKSDFLLNVLNGTLDLSNNNLVFIPHNADLLLSKICNVNYDPSATCKSWEKFLEEIMLGDKDKIRYLQKIAGISLTGDTKEETMFIMYGSTTRNGKSTFCETLMHLLGDYALNIRPESLAVKQNFDSRQANGDIARLDGCRLCNASEPPKRMLFDSAQLKLLLGRDSVTARHLHQREFTFIPKFKLIMNTNYLPTIMDDTVFSSGRINVISFDRHFEPHEQDKGLKERLRNESELSGILNWCIEGLRLYRSEGLNPPDPVRAMTETYRTDSDKIGNFIRECLENTGRNSKAKDVYEVFEHWCIENGYGVENKGNFFAELKAKNIFANSGTVGGTTVRNIVKGYTIIGDSFQEITEDIKTPFD